MRICLISKYPPIEGGVSSETYWLSRALGERGHQVHVVTNAWEVEDGFRMRIPAEEYTLLEPKNVSVYSTNRDFWSPLPDRPGPPIPHSEYFTEKLTSLALDVCGTHQVEVIYSHYYLPYGFVGMVTKLITGIPHVPRHAGSDIGTLWRSPYLHPAFAEILKSADKCICSKKTAAMLVDEGITVQHESLPMLVHPRYFNKDVVPYDTSSFFPDPDTPILLYLGKIGEMKQTGAFVQALAGLRERKFGVIFVVGTGAATASLKEECTRLGFADRCAFLPFQPPWKIPSLMRAARCVVAPEHHEPSRLTKGVHNPKIVREAMACGTCALMGEGVSQKGLYTHIERDTHAIVINPLDIGQFREKLQRVIEHPKTVQRIAENGYRYSQEHERFDLTIQVIERIFSECIHKT
jgi:glycosyltransferase involved in cell wall biosynthesis